MIRIDTELVHAARQLTTGANIHRIKTLIFEYEQSVAIKNAGGHPTIDPEKLEQHRTGLKWLLRFARGVYLTVSDPEYPGRDIADELKGRMLQLEHSWRMFHSPMPDAEAEKLLKEVFPE